MVIAEPSRPLKFANLQSYDLALPGTSVIRKLEGGRATLAIVDDQGPLGRRG